mgnify:CR=1 FL=1
MSHAGCRSSGLITADTKVFSGRCKLVSIHACNLHANTATIIIIYDNTAASGKVVAKLIIPGVATAAGNAIGGNTIEYDMHAVICDNGLYVDVTSGTPELTIEYA